MEVNNNGSVYKVILIGDSNVGKSSIIHRYCDDRFKEPGKTIIGCDFKSKTIEIDGETIKLQIWDTAGQERFRSLKKLIGFYKGSNGVIIVYDVTNQKSFDQVENWRKDFQDHISQEVPIFICGNKIDLADSRVISSDDGCSLADMLNTGFIETSAKEDTNINELFELLVSKMISS